MIFILTMAYYISITLSLKQSLKETSAVLKKSKYSSIFISPVAPGFLNTSKQIYLQLESIQYLCLN